MNENQDRPDTSSSQSSAAKRSRAKTEVPQEIQNEILRLHQFYGSREIARRVRRSRKIVR